MGDWKSASYEIAKPEGVDLPSVRCADLAEALEDAEATETACG
jgi:hypothetical protein